MTKLETRARRTAARLGALLLAQGKTLALAESCTGGLAASLVTDIAGSSEYFLGSAVTYAYSAKEGVLGVAHETLTTHGAVSAETAREMAQGARRLFGADVAVAITGIAGPGGGTPEKPVGLVYLHLSAEGVEIGERHVWDADRVGNKLLSAHEALEMVVRYLGENPSAASRPEDGATNLPGFPDEPVTVELRLLPVGQVAPEAFTWRGRRYPVTDVGRQWVDETEEAAWRCYLVRVPSGETFELRGDLARDRWVLGRAWPQRNARA